ncbi:D-alanyl-D-alanine carboxypeptidase family protein [Robertmurraya massiliosenegalensis]|uniref:D-alanyl-D-alanine carboxypeptidase family protein n=1 Tax=Robertmurraya massiliosenegalensis TaxID=1287657 RepID=UPI003D278B0A
MNAKTFAAELVEEPTIVSEAAIIIEESSGRVLFGKNSDAIMYPASLTKVATAIYAIEHGNLDAIVTTSEKARKVDGTRVYLEVGEKVPLIKLIQGLLINSGNDAGVAIAEYMHGTEEEFARRLTAYLKEIGLTDTNFMNPHGLFDPEHTTTARDLALLTQYAMQNEVFREIFGTTELKWDGEGWDTTIYTHHRLMLDPPYEGITGGKNGYVHQSGQTLITTAKRGDMSVIAVVLKGATQREIYNDTVTLLDYAFANFHFASIPKGKEFTMGDRMFITKEEHLFPISNDEEIKEEVTSDGLLKIENQNEEEIALYPITELEMPEIQTTTVDESNLVEKKEDSKKLNAFMIISIMMILAVFALLKNRNRRRRRMRKF